MKYKHEFPYDNRQDCLWEEYQDYIAHKPMTAYERRLVRNWVKEGNSVYGCTQSRYFGESTYPMEFLEVYRSDRAIDKELQGKTPRKRLSKRKSFVRPNLKHRNLSMLISASLSGKCSISGHLLWKKACTRKR